MGTISTYSLNIGGQLLELAEPQVMGILNVTPDSFYAESRRQTEQAVAERAEQIVAEGGTFIDIGACSTRPDSTPVDESEELKRLAWALTIVRRVAPQAIVSIDTFRARVAERVIGDFGPLIINDISGGADPEMFPLVARLGVPYVLTHNPSPTIVPTSAASPSEAQAQSSANPLVPAVLRYLSERVDRLLELGQKDILLDPGFGFGKTLEENYELLDALPALQAFGLPLLVGVSRKSMVYRLLGTSPQEGLNGTTVLHTLALERGARVLRTHDVRPAIETIRIVEMAHSNPPQGREKRGKS